MCIDKNKAIQTTCDEIAKEAGTAPNYEQIIQDNQTNPDFWKRVLEKGKGMVVEGNTRTE